MRQGSAWRGEAGQGKAGNGEVNKKATADDEAATIEKDDNMKKLNVVFTGGPTSLLMHLDDVEAADAVKAWRSDPKNKHVPKGDDRYPVWTWKTYLYHDGQHVALPTSSIMACIRQGGVNFDLGGSRKTLKAATQSYVRFEQEFLKIKTHDGRLVALKDIDKISDTEAFSHHKTEVGKLGFLLKMGRAKIGATKHNRVRPMFPPGWSMEGTVLITDEEKIPVNQFKNLLNLCGELVGLCDWRPGAPKSPGVYGRFTVKVDELEM